MSPGTECALHIMGRTFRVRITGRDARGWYFARLDEPGKSCVRIGELRLETSWRKLRHGPIAISPKRLRPIDYGL